MPISATLVLSGGLGLGAYQLGAYAALAASGRVSVEAIAGSSIGAINGAIIAGNAPEARVAQLRGFWQAVQSDSAPSAWSDPLEWSGLGTLRHARNWTSALAGRLAGVPNLFRIRVPGTRQEGVASLYDVAPSRDTLARFIDFDRLNGGETRLCIATTDVESGDTVYFDTTAGDRITLDHLLASSGLMPAFAPVRIEGRLLGDGGLSVNAPLDPFLASSRREPVPSLCILLDLFAPDVPLSGSLEAAAERSTDLQFACQTLVALDRLKRERALEARIDGGGGGTDLLHLSYRPPRHEAGPEKAFDFSRASIADRIASGRDDASAALDRLSSLQDSSPGLRVHRVRTSQPLSV